MPIFNYGNRKTNSNQNSNLICVFWSKHEGYIPFKKNLNALNFEVFNWFIVIKRKRNQSQTIQWYASTYVPTDYNFRQKHNFTCFYTKCLQHIINIKLPFSLTAIPKCHIQKYRWYTVEYVSNYWTEIISVSDWGLTPSEHFFSYVMVRTNYISMRFWWYPLCTRPTIL